MKPVITAKNICKSYQMGEVTVEALKNACFEIFRGELIVILGPSGSGKSTLLNITGGMDKPSKGELFYRGRALHSAGAGELTFFRRNEVGFVFQFYNLIPNLTASENVQLSAQIAQNPFAVEKVLARVDLSDRADHFPSQLSGGQQQRVALARAIAKNPALLLCDEPTGALDFQSGIQVLRLLKDFCTEYERTVVIITHNAAISQIADRIFYIKDGTVNDIVVNDEPLSPEKVTW